MRGMSGRAWMLAVALGLAAVSATSGGLRAGPIRHAVARRAPGSDPEKAAALRARAEVLMKDRARYREAAALLAQAAALTPVEDPTRAGDLYLASNLLFYSGALVGAQSLMAQSADAALERGDIETAADAFVNAGWLAAKRQQRGEAREYALRALHLTASPLLSPEQRDRLRARVVVPDPATTAATSPGGKPVTHTGFSVAAQRTRTGSARRAARPEAKSGTVVAPAR